MQRAPATVVLVAALVLASVPAPAAAAPVGPADRADPPGDPIGWEGGYWHNESISVDQSDGLSADEREAFVARSMARVEYVRGLEFKREVPVSVRPRSEVDTGTANRSAAFDAWNNQVWEALLIVGEDRDANELLAELYGGSIAGYYDPAADEIVVVGDGRTTIDNATLVHELTHALQDQYHNLSKPRYSGDTQDGDLAAQGIVEGEAAYVETRYAQRCGDAWSCVPAPGGSGGATPPNLGMYLAVYHPYSDGPPYVDALRERGGWEAVNRTLARPPNATEQVIHVTDQEPADISFNDTARNGWAIYPDIGENGSDTLGEASIFAGFWYQDDRYGTGVLDTDELYNVTGPYDAYDYSAAESSGWAGDRIYPYRQPSTGKDGYVWRSRWDTRNDATEFATAYIRSLSAHDARLVDPNTYVVSEGPYADAFYIGRDGTQVTIANAPTVEDLHDVLPASASPRVVGTIPPTPTAHADVRDNATLTPMPTITIPVTTATERSTTTASGATPGFGAGITLAALAAAVALLRRGR